ncbi:MAG: 50S ribosomal protein L19 [Helicobacter sp.]|nr:50S ribosomal protein L19 [Helicobacter sp.]MDE7196290.1 50S ribosomal protein L19 [Helicobacter sp.]
MRNRFIEDFEQAQMAAQKQAIPAFKAGDSLRVGIHIKEGDKSRVQYFEGVCIALSGQGAGRTFVIRKIGANGVGVERIFPLYSESIESIKRLRIGRVRRAKLYYLRSRSGKAARIKEIKETKKA